MKKFLKRTYFYVLTVIFLTLMVGVAAFNRPRNICVTSYLIPYNILNSVNSNDYLYINLLLNSNNSYFSDVKSVEKAYLTGNDNRINLKLEEVTLSKERNNCLKGMMFYNAEYKFYVDFHVMSEYKLELEEAFLNLEFKNGIKSVINVGSFTYNKYENTYNGDKLDISINNIRPINSNNSNKMFYGFQIGIKNVSEYNIDLNFINLLDCNLKNYKIYKSNELIDSYDVSLIDGLNEVNFNDEVILKGEDSFYIIIFDLSDYNLNIMITSLGLSLDYKIKGDTYKYTLEKYKFYKDSVLVNENVRIYEYAY